MTRLRLRQRFTALVLLLLLVCETGFALALTPGATGCCGHCSGLDGSAAVACEDADDSFDRAEPHSAGTAVPAPADRHDAAPCTGCGLHCGMSMPPFVFLAATPAIRTPVALAVESDVDVRLPASPWRRLERPPRFVSLVS